MYKTDILLNRDEYKSKVLGCWMGKNIGGTLGAPLEGKQDIFHYDFYVNEMNGEPAPNDDLDLQLVWLRAMEEKGVFGVNERVLGEYWMRHIVAAWNEYGIARNNIVNGLLPPLSGSTCNQKWEVSNGAWIRSEIWACVFAGTPDWASYYAISDACVDHADDGVYAEIFTASLESAAFIESDIRKLINCALARIPKDCRVARSVKIAIDSYDKGLPWEDARNAIVKDSEDLGWFQAPANIGFCVIGLLYGEGDFSKSLCTAVNCGDDTDCTGATVGSIMGILNGIEGIPEKWIKPIGHSIKTWAVSRFHLHIPHTIEELTDRVIAMKECASAEFPELARLVDGDTQIPEDIEKRLADGKWVEYQFSVREKNRLYFDLPWCIFSAKYCGGVIVEPGKPTSIQLRAECGDEETANLIVSWHLPEGWEISPSQSQTLMIRDNAYSEVEVTITPGPMAEAFEYIPLEVRLSNRQAPTYLTIPLRLAGAAAPSHAKGDWSAFIATSLRRGRSFAC